MAQTDNEVIVRALSILGVPGAGQEPSDEDMQETKNRLPNMLAALDAEGVIDAYGEDQTPDAWMEDIALLLASAVAPIFGAAGADADGVAASKRRLLSFGSGAAPELPTAYSDVADMAALIRRALHLNGVLSPDRKPHASTERAMKRIVSPLFSRLASVGIIKGVDPNYIPTDRFEPLAVYLASESAAYFGATAPDVSWAERQLRIMGGNGPTYATLAGCYF